VSSLTVTATGGGAAANGILLRVLVLTNAVVCASLAQNGTLPDNAAPANGIDGQAVNDNCLIYAICEAAASGTLATETGFSSIDSYFDAVNSQFRGSCVASAPLTAGTSYISGYLNPGSTYQVIASLEIDPSGGPIAQDASTPAAVYSTAASAATTASFTPPPGSLILAMVTGNSAGVGASTMAVTSSASLNWTLECFTGYNGGNSPPGMLAGIWYAYVPAQPAITTQTLPGAVNGQAYSFTLNATSGTRPYASWAVTAGSLPTGLSLSSAGVISGTPSVTGVYSATVTVTDAAGFTASATFGMVVNANSSPGGTIRATWALSAPAYFYGTLEIPVSTRDHDWLFVSVSWAPGEDAGIAYAADSAHNFYQPGPLAASAKVCTQVFAVPNARAASVIYVSTSAYVRYLNVQVTEVTGLQPGYTADVSNTFTAGPATSLNESLTTPNADFILAIGALTGAPQTLTQSGTGPAWTTLTGSFNGTASAGVTQGLAWAQTSGAASPAYTFTGSSGYFSGVMIAVKAAGGLPVNTNPAWPVISARAAFGYTPQQPTAPPVWTDITSRWLGLNGQRGRSFELNEIAAGDLTLSLDNWDGAFNPQNAASPYSPNVTLITPVEVLATWQGREYPLFRGLITAVPQTFDFQRGIVQAALSDDFAKLPQILLATCFIQEMLYDNPLNLWPLNDQQGAPYASNWSGRSGAQLVPQAVGGSTGGAAVATQLTVNLLGRSWVASQVTITPGAASAAGAIATPSGTANPTTGFGNTQSGIYPGGLASTTDPVWGNTSVLASAGGFQGSSLSDVNDATLPLTATGATYSVWANMLPSTAASGTAARLISLTSLAGPVSGTSYLTVLYASGLVVDVNVGSTLTTYTPPASLLDGKWHLWTVTVTTAGVVTLYIDAVSVLTFTGSFPGGQPLLLQYGGDSTAPLFVQTGQFTGYMTGAGVYDRVVDPERIQAWFLAGSTGFLDELAGTRIQRVLAWARWSAPQAIDPGLSLQQVFNYLTGGYGSAGLTGAIGNYQTAGGSAAVDTGAQADMTIQDICNTENGLLFMTAGGELFFRNRNALSSFPAGIALGDMDYPLNQTVRFAGGLGEWTTTASCTVAKSGGWSYCEAAAGLMTVTGTPASASVTGSQWPIQGGTAGFSAWVMSPQGCFAQLGISWYGQTYTDTYQANYTDLYGVPGGVGLISTTSGTLTYLPPMTPVQLTVPQTAAPGGTQDVQGVITIGSSPATGTQLYFDRTRLSPAGFQVPALPDNLSITEDIQYLFNDIAVTRNIDQVAYRVVNQASRSRYYPRIYTRTIFSSADDPNSLVNCATTLLNAFSQPQLRVGQMVIDAAADPEAWPFVLGTDIGDLVSYTRTPLGAPAVTGTFIVLSVEPDIAPDKATFTYTLIPAGVF
jgi:hypothetical protein